MKERILSYASHIPSIAGIEASFGEEGIRMHLVLLKRKGNSLSVVRREAGVTSIDKLVELLPADMPLVLSINGKGIIHRFVKQTDIRTDTDPLRLILPNAKKQDFYVQQYQQQRTAILSVIRKDRLQELLAVFQPLQERILSVSLGPFHIAPFLGEITSETAKKLQISQHGIDIEENEIVAYRWEETERQTKIIRIAGEEMNERLLPAFGLAFLLLSQAGISGLAVEGIAGKMEEKQQQWLFKRSAMVLGAFFLLVLLLNTYYFLHYNTKMTETAPSDATLLEKEVNQLKEVLKGQEQLVGIIHYADREGKEPFSYIADQLGQTVPREILLEELTFFPKDDAATRKERKPVYQSGTLHIKGSTASIGVLNHWIKAISMLGFGREVSLVNYKYDEKQERGVFNLKMILQP